MNSDTLTFPCDIPPGHPLTWHFLLIKKGQFCQLKENKWDFVQLSHPIFSLYFPHQPPPPPQPAPPTTVVGRPQPQISPLSPSVLTTTSPSLTFFLTVTTTIAIVSTLISHNRPRHPNPQISPVTSRLPSSSFSDQHCRCSLSPPTPTIQF